MKKDRREKIKLYSFFYKGCIVSVYKLSYPRKTKLALMRLINIYKRKKHDLNIKDRGRTTAYWSEKEYNLLDILSRYKSLLQKDEQLKIEVVMEYNFNNSKKTTKKTQMIDLYDSFNKFWYIKRICNNTINFVKEKRKQNKVKYSTKNIYGIRCKKNWNVYTEFGSFLKAQKAKKCESVYSDKSPKNKYRYVGIELEFCSPMNSSEIAIELLDAGVLKYCNLRDDASLRPKSGEFGHELCILVKEKEVNFVLNKACMVLNKVKAVSDESRKCGLHVHLDMRNRNIFKNYYKLLYCQDILMKMTPKERRDTQFCKKIKTTNKPELDGDQSYYSGNRYKTINAMSYSRHKTLEVRLFHGSVNYEEIVNWVNLLVSIAKSRKVPKQSLTSVKQIGDAYKLKKQQRRYMRSLIKKFA